MSQTDKYQRTIIAICLLVGLASAQADEQATGLYHELTDANLAQLPLLRDWGVNLGAWATAGYTYNTDNPRSRNNGPVYFNNRANELHLYQLYSYLERQTHKGDAWDLGGRLDVMFGTDSPYSQATGHWDVGLIDKRSLRLYDLALPQAYAEVYTPWGNGVTTKIGHFYSIIGYESVPSVPNFFSSHTYSMKSAPFTVTGFLSSYTVNGNFGVDAGSVTGPDNFDRSLGAWSFMGGFHWNSDDKATGFSFSTMNGPTNDTQSSNLSYYNAVFHQDFTPKLHYVLQHDRGFQHKALGNQDAEWYSIVQYLTYDVADTWGMGLRGEWFRDDDGFRFASGAASYYALSGGVNWKPLNWLMVRPEIRYDWASARSKPFDSGQKSNQLLLGLDAVVLF